VPAGGNCYGWHCGKIIAVGSHTPLVAGDANIFWNITSDANGKLYALPERVARNTPENRRHDLAVLAIKQPA